MVKSKDKIIVTAEEYQQSGDRYYELALDMEDNNAPQGKIDASWRMAAKEFWQALVLGSEKAPFSLFKCFGQGLGVKEDADIAALFYGVALKLTPQSCNKIPVENRPAAPDKAMKSRIDDLLKLVKQTHSKISNKEVAAEKLFDQMDTFDKAIKLPGKKSIEKCFTEKSTAATTHDEYGASTSGHNISADSGVHDKSFDELGDVAMGGESSHHYHH